MGLLVDIKGMYNHTMADVKDVYIRIELLHVFPKLNAIRANVTGFISPESGYIMKQKEIAEVKQVEEFLFTNEILNAEVFDRDNHMPPMQTGQEPLVIFRDYYTIYMKDKDGNIKDELKDIKLCDLDAIHDFVYSRIKQYETRFENARDI